MGLAKQGTGTQNLGGSLTYSGATLVNGGTLNINGRLSYSANGITVGSGGTLGGTGLVGRAVTINDGALAPGNSTGLLSFTNGREK